MRPAVMLSFDDIYIDDWFGADSMFHKYDAKVTFFVTHLLTLDSNDYAKLLILQDRGHEIGCHSLTHYDPVQYMDSAGIENYLSYEVDSALAILRARGFKVSSFAFPFGKYTDALKDSLEKRNLFLRGGIYNKTDLFHRSPRPLDKWDVYVKHNGQIFTEAMGIDNVYSNPLELILPGIERCRTDSIGLVLYAHRISNQGVDYFIHPLTLDSIFRAGKENGVRFTTFSKWRSEA
jgi:peptidoglycan/xylan/chitin deacetylase (PgdA/CDA1 family)